MNDLYFVRNIILKEMAAIHEMSEQLKEDIVSCIQLLYECKGRVVFSGVGKSGHIGKKLAATFASTGTPAFFVHACEAVHGDLGMIEEDDIVILLSHSGRTQEILGLLSALKSIGCAWIVICSDESSPLACNSEYKLIYPRIQEADRYNLAPTISCTLMLVLGDAIACTLMEKKEFKEQDFFKYHPGGNLGKRLEVKLHE